MLLHAQPECGAKRKPWRDRLVLVAARMHARRGLGQFLAAADDAVRTQDRVLAERIRLCAGSEMGRALGLGSIRTYADFVAQVPIQQYENIEPYIDLVKLGRTTAMFAPGTRLHMFAKTSGSTRRPKYIPVTDAFLQEYRRGWNAFGVKFLYDHDCFLRPLVQVSSPSDEERTALGIPCGAITGLMAATQKRIVRRYYIVPPATAYVSDAAARYYCVVRIAAPHDVAFIVAASPATQLNLARTLDTHAQAIIRDVRDGTLTPPGEISTDLHRQLSARLRPDPAGARRLENIVARTQRLRPADVWNLALVVNWTGGTMGLFLQDFPQYFGNVPVRDPGLIASEGRITIPLEDGTPSGVLNVPDNFYEFIPADEYESPRRTVLRCHELEVGKHYYVLLTTSAGFFRYDLGDCVRVTGFRGRAPLLEFLHRGTHTASITGEKLTEQQAVMAYGAATNGSGLGSALFVLAPQWGNPPFYRLHVEADGSIFNGIARRELAAVFDRQLQAINIEYASKRTSGRLADIDVNVLPPGWLARQDREKAMSQRAVNEQFKHRYLFSAIAADKTFPCEKQG
jgi:hypothetical protein